MERLTKWNGSSNQHAYYPRCFEEPCNGGGCKIKDCPFETAVCERLAAYEDTNLTPEDLNAPFTWQTVLNQASQKALGMEPSRLRELAEAEKDGRCVVLPCKVGDVLYAAESAPVIPLHVMEAAIYLALEGEDGGDYERISNIGKTVFLTREEAERAMEGKKNGKTQKHDGHDAGL